MVSVLFSFFFKHPIVVLIGIGLIALSFYVTWRKHNMLLTGHLADGEVIELIPHTGSKGGVSYSLRVSYRMADGREAQFATSASTSPPLHQLHEKIRVVYYPDATSPDILAYQDLYLFPWILFCVGLFILLMCAGFIFGPVLINSIYPPHFLPPDPLKPVTY